MQLNVLISSSKQQVDDSVGELTFENGWGVAGGLHSAQPQDDTRLLPPGPPSPQTPNPAPQTLNPKPSTLNPQP